MSSEELDKIKGEIAETKEKIALEEAKLVPSEALLVAQQYTLTEQLKEKNILLARAVGKFAFFSSLSIILIYFIIILLISSFVFSCSFFVLFSLSSSPQV